MTESSLSKLPKALETDHPHPNYPPDDRGITSTVTVTLGFVY